MRGSPAGDPSVLLAAVTGLSSELTEIRVFLLRELMWRFRTQI